VKVHVLKLIEQKLRAVHILTQNKNLTLFIIGFTILEIKTPVPHNAGNEIQSFVGMFNFYQLGSKFIKKRA